MPPTVGFDTGYNPPPPQPRKRRKIIIFACLIVLLLVATFFVWHHGKDDQKATPQAMPQTQQVTDQASSEPTKKSSQPAKHNSKKTSKNKGSGSTEKTSSSATTDKSTSGSTSGDSANSDGGSSNSGGGDTGGGDSGGGDSTGGGGTSYTTLHYTANIGSDQAFAASLGFNMFDIAGSQSNPSGLNSRVNALPTGVKALVWVGNLDNAPKGGTCPAPGFSYSQFTAQVDALKNNPRVFGYYLADEPHPSVCPNAASDIKARADYIHSHAPGQKAFIVVLDGYNLCDGNYGCEYAALNPSKTHVDYIGLDPYPCHYDSSLNPVPCDTSEITDRVNSAIANGIPKSAIVPTFQTFGQAGRTDGGSIYYRLPTTSELTDMINLWHSLVPHPAFDYAYSFGTQGTSPQAIVNHPEIQTIVKNHNNST